MSTIRRTHSREFRLRLWQRVELGQVTKTQACREYALSPSPLDRWVQSYREKGSDAFPSCLGTSAPDRPVNSEARMKDMEASIGRLHLENEFLREALGKLGIPVRRSR